MANALLDVQATFTSLDKRYSILRAACRNATDRGTLAGQYTTAETAYYACVDKTLADDDAAVASLCTDLKTANGLIDQSVAQMGNMSKVLDNITKALALGAQLLAKL